MEHWKRRVAKYRLAISTVIWKERHAVFTALVHRPIDSLEHKMAVHLLQEARWDRDEFVAAYRAGYLND